MSMKAYNLFLLSLLFPAVCFAQTTIRAEMDDSSPATCSEGGQCLLRETTNRSLHVNLRNASGGELGTASDPVNVEGTVTSNIGTTGGLALDTSVDGLEGLVTSGNSSLSTLAGGVTASVYQMNVKQINGVTTTMGNGISGTGVQRVTIASDSTGTIALNAGSALVGKVGIDQTTPGTTNAISLAQINATTTAAGNGVVGNGVQRVAIASDNTAFSVNATNIPSTVSSATHATGGVTTTSAQILASSAGRKAGFIQNVSDTTVWLSLGGTATAAAPTIELVPLQTYDLTTGGYCYTGAVNAIHGSSGTKNVSIVTF